MREFIGRSWNGVDAFLERDHDGMRSYEYTPKAVQQAIKDEVHAIRREGVNRKANMKPVAEIPVQMWQSWRLEYRNNPKINRNWSWDEFLRMKVSHPDHSALRVTDGRLGRNCAFKHYMA